jgi:hypothetical protein
MNERDLLRPLRDQPLPTIPPELSARIRAAARERFGKPRGRVLAVFAKAAVVFLCVTHLVWTVAFLERVQAPVAQHGVLR